MKKNSINLHSNSFVFPSMGQFSILAPSANWLLKYPLFVASSLAIGVKKALDEGDTVIIFFGNLEQKRDLLKQIGITTVDAVPENLIYGVRYSLTQRWNHALIHMRETLSAKPRNELVDESLYESSMGGGRPSRFSRFRSVCFCFFLQA